jgi:hypothetical protein
MNKLKSYFPFILLLILGYIPSLAQNVTLNSVEIEGELIESGENKNYYSYDLGDYIFFNGAYEHNLTFRIQDKFTGKIEFTYEDSVSDAMILIPNFFCNEDHSLIVAMIEVAVEYSWGQQIVLIKNKTVKYLGYLNYAVAGDQEESLAEYCRIQESDGKILILFDDVPIIDYLNDDKIINEKALKFELSSEGIEKITTSPYR